VNDPADVVGVVAEVFTWAGGIGAVILGIILLVVIAVDGTWLAADAIADREGPETVVRWFTPNGVGTASLSHADADELGDRHETPVFYRSNRLDRARLHARHPSVKPLVRMAIGLASLWLVSTAIGLVLIAI